jgi:hypothetical protein
MNFLLRFLAALGEAQRSIPAFLAGHTTPPLRLLKRCLWR